MERYPDDLYSQILKKLSEMETEKGNIRKEELFSNKDKEHLTSLNSRKVKEFLEMKDIYSEDEKLEDVDDINEEELKYSNKNKSKSKKQKDELDKDTKKTRKLLKIMIPIQLILLSILLYLLYTKIYDTRNKLDIFPTNKFEIVNSQEDTNKTEDEKNEDNIKKEDDNNVDSEAEDKDEE